MRWELPLLTRRGNGGSGSLNPEAKPLTASSTPDSPIHQRNRDRLSPTLASVYTSVDYTPCVAGVCLLQLKVAPTCMSTSCLIILPSAHLSAARASPRNVGTRSCRKGKGRHFPPSFPGKGPG